MGYKNIRNPPTARHMLNPPILTTMTDFFIGHSCDTRSTWRGELALGMTNAWEGGDLVMSSISRELWSRRASKSNPERYVWTPPSKECPRGGAKSRILSPEPFSPRPQERQQLTITVWANPGP